MFADKKNQVLIYFDFILRIIEFHMILIENFVNFAENFDKSLIIFYFDFVIKNHHNNAD